MDASVPPLSKVKYNVKATLVLPTAVVGNFCVPATISFMVLPVISATKTLPLPSTATSLGEPPVLSVFTVELELTTPSDATISFTALLPSSATKTSPIPSTHTP